MGDIAAFSQDEPLLNKQAQRQWPPKSSVPYDPEQVCIFPSKFKRGQILQLKGSENVPVTLVDQHGDWWSVKLDDETRCTYHETELTEKNSNHKNEEKLKQIQKVEEKI